MRSLLLCAAIVAVTVGPACAVSSPERASVARATARYRAELAAIEGDRTAIPNDDPALTLFGEVLELVVRDHVRPQDADALTAKAIDGARAARAAKPEAARFALTEAGLRAMTKSLDPYSEYLDAEAYRYLQEQTQGEFAGIGAEVSADEATGLVKVNAVIDGSPSLAAGVRAGDLISEIDGRSIKGKSLGEAVSKLRGAPGTRVDLTVRRGADETKTIAVTRAIVRIPSIRSHVEADGIGYIRISSFNSQTADDLDAATRELTRDVEGGKLRGLVLDVRDDLGGLLDQAVKVSDRFLGSAVIVSVKGRARGENSVFRAHDSQAFRGVPMVVLTNSSTASASEIVAGALRDNGRAQLMGVRSYGKGSVQTLSPLDFDAGLRLTTARYYRPSGALVDCFGLTPDIRVPGADGGAKEIHADPAACDPGQAPPPEVRSAEMDTACPVTAREAPDPARDRNGDDGDYDQTVRCAVEYLGGHPKPPAKVPARAPHAKVVP